MNLSEARLSPVFVSRILERVMRMRRLASKSVVFKVIMIGLAGNFTPRFWSFSRWQGLAQPFPLTTNRAVSRNPRGLLAVLSFVVLSASACSAAGPDIGVGTSNDYAQCMAKGGRMLKTYPARCVDGSGNTFVDPSPSAGKIQPPPSRKLCVDRCGDGECQEMVCMGEGCPCGESVERCPQDCQG
jgi:hypothetical protein